MTSRSEQTPESLAELRDQVEVWIDRAREAVASFCNTDQGWFWRDSNKVRSKASEPSVTTTARCYMALVYAEQCRGRADNEVNSENDWINWLTNLSGTLDNFNDRYVIDKTTSDDEPKQNGGNVSANGDGAEILDVFEVAHLADLLFARDAAVRFRDFDSTPFQQLTHEHLVHALHERLKEIQETASKQGGRFSFGKGTDDQSHHYFVSLHCLRAFQILRVDASTTDDGMHLRKIIDDFRCGDYQRQVQQFCIEQYYNSQRSIQHARDSIQLSFAGVIHAHYGQPVRSDLCAAIIDALESGQQNNGTWPATHPIFRGKQKEPWHITSHEVALCLTWLYFQPRIRDASRFKLVAMMERYFRNWVIPTYIEPQPLDGSNPDVTISGWYDDHHVGTGLIVGWATAIVCHFLTNYYHVLNDFLNRRVIESLGLQDYAREYLVDETLAQASSRWKYKNIPTWFDLPPFLLSDPFDFRSTKKAEFRRPEKVGRWASRRLAREWTDPSEPSETPAISAKLGSKLLAPVQIDIRERPAMDFRALIIHGPPGTRKTTLVKEIASQLRWTKVTVPYSAIFAEGWDRMEAQASVVFQRLKYLTKCVIFFDEFEEFLKQRGPAEGNSAPIGTDAGARTPAAFITSSMLPRMQDLYDARRSIVLLATNYFEDVDQAARRVGRFDYRLEIPHPNLTRAINYAENPSRRTKIERLKLDNEWSVPKETWEPVKVALELLDTAFQGEFLFRREPFRIPFAAIEEALFVSHQKEEARDPNLLADFLRRKSETDAPDLLQNDPWE